MRQSKGLRRLFPLAVLACTGLLAGCHSAFVQATVVNGTGRPLQVFEVDYPDASFGSSALAPGAEFHTRFKIAGDGPAKLTWTDAGEKEHTAQGPVLHQGMEGTLRIVVNAAGATWVPNFRQNP